MNQKKAKALRKAVREAHLKESLLMINNKTGQIRRGMGARAVIQKLKKASPAVREAFAGGVTPAGAQ